MTGPRLGMGMPPDESWIPKKFEDLQRQINELRAARTLEAASIGAGGLTSANFDGTLDPPAAGTAGFGLAGKTGNAIFNNIVLRGGIIGDDALTNPVSPFQFTNAVSATLTTTQTNFVTATITVPAGFTSASILALGTVEATNPGTGAVNFLCATIIQALSQANSFGQVQPGAAMTFSSHRSAILTGLTGGGTITAKVAGYHDAPAGNWSGQAYLDVLGMFFR